MGSSLVRCRSRAGGWDPSPRAERAVRSEKVTAGVSAALCLFPDVILTHPANSPFTLSKKI